MFIFTMKNKQIGVSLFRNFKTIRTFYRLSKTKPALILCMFLSFIIPAILSIWTPILLANTITAITVYDFSRAINQTIIEFGIVLVSAFSYFIYHLISTKVNSTIITNFHNYIYYNVKNNSEIKDISISILKDVNSCVEFNKKLIYKSCFFIKAIIILIIIAFYNYIISLIIIAVSIISFFLLKLTDNKIQTKTQELNKCEKISLDLFNSFCGGGNAEQKYNLDYALKDKYFSYVKENIKTSNSISLFYNINNNFISLILKTNIFISTIFLITMIRSTELTLSVYLILTPYLTSSAESLISFFDIFSEIALIDNILKNFESLKYTSSPKQEKPILINSYNLYFHNASFGENSKLKNINLKIDYKSAICFIGDEDYKIEELFNVLSKKTLVSSGCIFLDDKNISDINIPSFNKSVASITTNEQFFNISIYENFYLVCPSKNKITKTIKNLGLTDLINSFDDKINTKLNGNICSKHRFFLGLTRAYLSDAKIINIYKYPETLSKSEKELLKNILTKINKSCTIICYFNHEQFSEIFDEIYFIENNKLKMNKLSKNADNNIRN